MPDEKPAPITLINPDVIQVSEEWATREEGCLSLPGQYADVSRPARIRVRYEDEAGARRELDADGLLAACLQHEIDHLDGVLFIDKLSSTGQLAVREELSDFEVNFARLRERGDVPDDAAIAREMAELEALRC